jgi:uncharacterized protein (DUF1697 family)
MPAYVAFLRAINLGANRKFPKDAIRSCVEGLGFTDVATYINTGNVRFTTPMRSRAKIEAALEDAFLADRGFAVPTMVFTPDEVGQVARDAEELTAARELDRHYVYLLKEEPSAGAVADAESRSDDVNAIVVRGRAAHVLLGPGYVAGSVDPFRVEKLLGVATNRNYKVVTALAEMWC